MRRLSCLAVGLFCAFAIARGQSGGQLQEQLQELKQQYAETTRALERRIAALEQQIEKEKAAAAKLEEGTVSAAALAKEAAEKSLLAHSDEVGAKFQGAVPSAPTHDLLREAEQKISRLEQQVGSFEFHGYFRSGNCRPRRAASCLRAAGDLLSIYSVLRCQWIEAEQRA